MTIRVVLADDHVVVRTGLRAMLDGEPDIQIVGEAANGAEVVALSGRVVPDVVLMDLRMPEVDGVTAIATIRERHPSVHVLVLTTYDTDADILRAVEAGATGYLLKDATRDEVLHAIRSAAVGEAALAPRVASRLMGRMRAPGEEALSSREVEVLAPSPGGLPTKRLLRPCILVRPPYGRTCSTSSPSSVSMTGPLQSWWLPSAASCRLGPESKPSDES
jgi:DNA-binding NarL/FixJ family response regulator